MRRLIKSLIPAPFLTMIRELRALTPAQRAQYVRSGFSGGSLRSLPPGITASSCIVFVCYGNIFRSPMAEALFAAELARRGIPTEHVSSAGLSARDGREAHANGVEVARTMGISLEAHRARLLTAEIVATSDLVVVMDRVNVAVYRERFPAARDRVVLLGAFDPEVGRLGAVIPDPYGRPREEVVQCYERLERTVRALAQRIVDGR